MSEPKTYTATDIERYHRGEMSVAEMHLLEKAALDDPMLADMLEGYRFTSTPVADLESLQNNLRQRIERDRRKGVVIFSSPWLRIAALFILIVGGGWLVFQTLSSKNARLAKSNAQEEQSQIPSKTDSTSLTVQTVAPLLKADTLPKANDVAVNEKKPNREFYKKRSTSKLLPRPVENNLVAKAESKDKANAASLMQAENQHQDSTTGVAAIKGYTSAPVARSANDSTLHLDIVLKPVDAPLTEVVVAKTKKQAKQETNRRQQPVAIADTLEPEEGWDSFDEYITENLKVPQNTFAKPSNESEVELSFNVDKEGNPVNIKITKSLCDPCDTEAIRLLKEGPKWKGKKGKVKIKFPLSP
jgi:hypothetical protein